MLAFVFPGQGSQSRGMGANLFGTVREFLAVERDVDQLLGYSIRELCLTDAGDKLKETQYTQPALYTVSALAYYDAMARGSPAPRFLAGHSLGEFNALLAAGAFDFLTGLKLVQERGRIMSRAKNGRMAAVIGLGAARIAAVLREGARLSLDVANFNSPTQAVVSGPAADIASAGPLFEAAGARMYMPLNVSAAFHSRYMSESSRAFEDFLQGFKFQPLRIPVVANATGELYPAGDPTQVIRSLLVRQIDHSVQWVKSVRYLIAAGVTTFKELGPGTVLTRLIQQIQQQKDE